MGRFVRCSNIIPNPTPFVNTFFEIFSAFFKKTFFYPFSLVKRGDSAAFPSYYICIQNAIQRRMVYKTMYVDSLSFLQLATAPLDRFSRIPLRFFLQIFFFSILSPTQLAPLFCVALQPLNPLLICLAVWYREIERFFNTYSDMIIGLCPSHSVAWTP